MKKKHLLYLLILNLCMSSCSFFELINNAVNENVDENFNSRKRSKDTYINNEFSQIDKNTISKYFSFDIPYLANDSYEIVDYTNDISIFYYKMQKNDYNNYIDTLDATYEKVGELYNSYGNKTNTYKNETTYLDLSFEKDKECIRLDVYDESLYSNKREYKNSKGYLLENNNKGLPNSSSNYYDIDLEKDYVVANNASYLASFKDGCKSVGSPNVLVIPVEFSDALASDKGYTIEAIKNAMLPYEETKAELNFLSLYDYFYQSSFEKLSLNITIMDEWFKPKYASSYYKDASFSVSGETLKNGEQIVLNEALEYYDSKGYDLSLFDEDGNQLIDSIIMINTLDIEEPTTMDDSFNWAFRFYNYYLKDSTHYYTYDGVAANDYVWANYQFLFSDSKGKYTLKEPLNTYTFIHEFSHIIGAEDYYNYYSSTMSGPLIGLDLMDETPCDHNPFTKMNFGWLNNAKLVLNYGYFKLESIEKGNTCYILASDFDVSLGIYQEYYLVCYYTNENINEKYHMFSEPTVAIYHVDASLLKSDGNLSLINDNDSYTSGGSKNNLIELTAYYNIRQIKLNLVRLFTLETNNKEKIPFSFSIVSKSDGIYLRAIV